MTGYVASALQECPLSISTWPPRDATIAPIDRPNRFHSEGGFPHGSIPSLGIAIQ